MSPAALCGAAAVRKKCFLFCSSLNGALRKAVVMNYYYIYRVIVICSVKPFGRKSISGACHWEQNRLSDDDRLH